MAGTCKHIYMWNDKEGTYTEVGLLGMEDGDLDPSLIDAPPPPACKWVLTLPDTFLSLIVGSLSVLGSPELDVMCLR